MCVYFRSCECLGNISSTLYHDPYKTADLDLNVMLCHLHFGFSLNTSFSPLTRFPRILAEMASYKTFY